MQRFGRELEFINQINSDGSGVTSVDNKYLEYIKNDRFQLSCLSITEKTWIASGFNSFVVKLKCDILPTQSNKE